MENNITKGIAAYGTLFRGYKPPLQKKTHTQKTDLYKQVHEF